MIKISGAHYKFSEKSTHLVSQNKSEQNHAYRQVARETDMLVPI